MTGVVEQPVGSPDEALLDRLADGDRHALAQLYARHADGAYALAQQLCAAHAASIVDGAFLALWRQVRAGHRDGPVGERLLHLTRQRALAMLHDGHDHAPCLGPPGRRAPVSLIELDEREARAALAGLPAAECQCVEMAYFDALSVAQTATLTRLPPAAVSDYLRRGMRGVRRQLTAQSTVEHPTVPTP